MLLCILAPDSHVPIFISLNFSFYLGNKNDFNAKLILSSVVTKKGNYDL